MSSTLTLPSRTVSYSVRESSRARRMRITVYPGGDVVLTVPRRASGFTPEKFLRAHSRWLLGALLKFERLPKREQLPGGRRDYLQMKTSARILARDRIKHFNAHYKFNVGRISIRNQSSRWGSCSHKGNLNFNYRIVHLPKEITDYVVVHELCHIAEMNHSERFWARVAETIPNWKRLRKELQRFAMR